MIGCTVVWVLIGLSRAAFILSEEDVPREEVLPLAFLAGVLGPVAWVLSWTE